MPFNAQIPLGGQSLQLPDMLGNYGRLQSILAQQQQMELNALHGQLYQAQAQRAMQQAAKEEAAQQANNQIIEQLAQKNPELAGLLRIAPGEAIKRLYPTPVTVGRSLVDPTTGKVIATDETWAAEQQASRESRAQEIQARFAEMERARADRFAQQESMARLAASLRPPQQPHITAVDDPNNPGQAMYVPTSQAVGMRPATKSEPPAKALPTSAAQKLFENQQNLRRAEQGLALIQGKTIGEDEGSKKATGWKGFLPDPILQRYDPEGVPTRAAVADLGSLIVHDRSGAAVTASETPRLKPFIPQITDDPKTVEKKLNRFVEEYRKIATETADFYKESGYKVPVEALQGSGVEGSGWSIKKVK